MGAVTHPPRDLTPLPDLLHDAPGPARSAPRRPVYLDLLPLWNAGCPAKENIQADPVRAEHLLGLAQQEVNRRWITYEEMATQGAERFPPSAHGSST